MTDKPSAKRHFPEGSSRERLPRQYSTKSIDEELLNMWRLNKGQQPDDKLCLFFCNLYDCYDLESYDGEQVDKMSILLRVVIDGLMLCRLGSVDDALDSLAAGKSPDYALLSSKLIPKHIIELLRILEYKRGKDPSFDVDECLENWYQKANSALIKLDEPNVELARLNIQEPTLWQTASPSTSTASVQSVPIPTIPFTVADQPVPSSAALVPSFPPVSTAVSEVTAEFRDASEYAEEFQKWTKVSQKCLNPSYLHSLVKLLKDLSARKQSIYPFVFLCAPSGSGKTTLAYNLGTGNVPFLYFLYNFEQPGRGTQKKYDPFKEISVMLRRILKRDVEKVEAIVKRKPLTPGDVDSWSIRLMSNADDPLPLKFSTVGFIVSLFKYVCKVKLEQSELTWLEIQFNMKNVHFQPLDISTGKAILREIVNNDYSIPFVAFIDEAVLSKWRGDVFILEEDASELILLRSLLRLMTVIPFLSGTDAITSNFLTNVHSSSSRTSGKSIWCACLCDLDGFSPKVIHDEASEVVSHFGDSQKSFILNDIFDFLKSIHEFENPLFIRYSINYLSKLSARNIDTTAKVLCRMVRHVFKEFTDAKNSGDEFTEAQFGYLYSYALGHSDTQSLLFPSLSHEFAINRHLGMLVARPFAAHQPYFYLGLSQRPYPTANRAQIPDEPSVGTELRVKYGQSQEVSAEEEEEEDSKGKSPILVRPAVPKTLTHFTAESDTDIEGSSSTASAKPPGTFYNYSSLVLQASYIDPTPSEEIFSEDSENSGGESDAEQNWSGAAYKPESTFQSFRDAPLTGMVLFGLDVGSTGLFKPPFLHMLNDVHSSIRVSTLDAAIDNFWTPRSQPFKKSGLFLEYLFNGAMVVASRGDSFEGSPFRLFLSCLIRELSTSRVHPSDPLTMPLSNVFAVVDCQSNAFDDKIIPLISPMSVSSWHPAAVTLMRKASNGKCRLGTFFYSTGSEVVDTIVLEVNSDGPSTDNSNRPFALRPFVARQRPTTISFGKQSNDEWPDKRYTNWGKVYPLESTQFRGVPLIAECKQYAAPLSLKEIVDEIIYSKFHKNLSAKSPIHGVNLTTCQTYIIMTMTANDLSQSASQPETTKFEEVLAAGFNLWQLQPRATNQYSIKFIFGMEPRQENAKDVVVISLDTIVGRDFINSLIAKNNRTSKGK